MGSNARRSMRLSARHRAMDVSSVHSPGRKPKGPPPTMSSMGSKESGGLNSRVVPSASPTARPSRHPRYRSIGSIELSAQVMEATSELDEAVAELQVVEEAAGQAGEAVVGTADPARHGRHCVRVVACIHSRE